MNLPDNVVELLNHSRGGLERLVGLSFTAASQDRVVAELVAGHDHHQPYGLVHGGLYALMIETVCSVGAALNAMPEGQSTVGLDNHTTFLRAHREGRLIATATPIKKGRRTHLWQAEVRDEAGKLCAQGQVQVMCLEAGASVAGEELALKVP